MVSDQDEIVVIHRGVTTRFIPVGSGLEPTLRQNRFYEATMLNYIASLRLGGTYVDVGGYIGNHALFFAQHCPAAVVHTFEPSPTLYPALVANVAVNQLAARIVTHQLGLSDRAETVDFAFEGRQERFECERLDAVVTGPVSLLKIDVEGFEGKVLAGAARLIADSRPLVFVEAHTADELARDAALLAPYGYRPTGRVFNASPTYELAAAGSPVAPPERLPEVVDLLHRGAWNSVEDGLTTTWSPDGRLLLAAASQPPQRLHLTQEPAALKRAPEVGILSSCPGELFVQMVATMTPGMAASLFCIEYDATQRTAITRKYFHPRLFERLELRADTRAIRLVIGVEGAGELSVERLALHIPRR